MSKASRKQKNQKTSTPVLSKQKRPAEADSFEKEVCGLENTAEIIESEHSKNKRDLGINEILYINENAPFTQSAFFGENCACEIFGLIITP